MWEIVDTVEFESILNMKEMKVVYEVNCIDVTRKISTFEKEKMCLQQEPEAGIRKVWQSVE